VNLHEYQARALLKAAGVPMLDGDVASTPTEAEAIARRIGGTVVIKAQVTPADRAGRSSWPQPGRGGRWAARFRHDDQGPHGAQGARGPAAEIATEATSA
jgi:hypothetical protein